MITRSADVLENDFGIEPETNVDGDTTAITEESAYVSNSLSSFWTSTKKFLYRYVIILLIIFVLILACFCFFYIYRGNADISKDTTSTNTKDIPIEKKADISKDAKSTNTKNSSVEEKTDISKDTTSTNTSSVEENADISKDTKSTNTKNSPVEEKADISKDTTSTNTSSVEENADISKDVDTKSMSEKLKYDLFDKSNIDEKKHFKKQAEMSNELLAQIFEQLYDNMPQVQLGTGQTTIKYTWMRQDHCTKDKGLQSIQLFNKPNPTNDFYFCILFEFPCPGTDDGFTFYLHVWYGHWFHYRKTVRIKSHAERVKFVNDFVKALIDTGIFEETALGKITYDGTELHRSLIAIFQDLEKTHPNSKISEY